jgi:hypothetical protein
MSVGVAVSVMVDGAPADPADLVGWLSSVDGVRARRVGDVVWLLVEEASALGAAADLVARWWREQGTAAVLRVAGTLGVSDLSYLLVDDIDLLRQILQAAAEPVVQPDMDGRDFVGPPLPAGPGADRSTDFTARLVGIADEDGILSVGVAEQSDGSGRTLVLQGVDPTSPSTELLEPEEGYCVIVDGEATVYGGLAAVGLRDGRLQITFTPRGARTLHLPTKVTITLDVDDTSIEELGAGIRRVIAYGAGADGPPVTDLE